MQNFCDENEDQSCKDVYTIHLDVQTRPWFTGCLVCAAIWTACGNIYSRCGHR